MQDIFWIVAALCAVAVSAALIPLLISLKRSSDKAQRELDLLHQELPATLESVRLAGAEVQEAAQHVTNAGERLEKVAGTAGDLAGSTLGFLISQGTRLGRFAMVAAGLVKGVRAAVETFGRHRASGKETARENSKGNEKKEEV